ncbi:MAG: tetratricopeptide repeat protein [Spirochaetales bacterium]|nr:tetratricopeptide repeat protein [Spirochaetales bacterium]
MATIIILSIALTLIFGIIVFLMVRRATNHNISSIQTLVKQGKTSHAIDLLKKSIAKDPQNVDAHFLLAKAFMAENKAELAFMEIKTINKIGEFSAICPEKEFRQLSSKLFLQFGKHDEALKDYLLLIKLSPYESNNYYNVGLLFEERQKSAKAVNYYKKTIELDPRHSGAYMHLGMIMFNSKRYKDAKNYLDMAIKYDDSNFAVYFYIGKIFKEGKDYISALEAFEKSLREKTLKFKALIERGICYISLSKPDLGIAELEKAISYGERDSEANVTEQQNLYAHYFLAMAYEQIRNLDRAIEHWQFINNKKKNFKDVSEKLSQYKELQENDKMKDYLTSNKEEFIEICKAVCEKINLAAQDIKEHKSGIQLIGLELGKKDWKASKKLPYLVRFLRDSTPVTEVSVRNILDEMKNLNIMKSILISSTEITSDAKKFAESRPIEIIGKRKLLTLLNEI